MVLRRLHLAVFSNDRTGDQAPHPFFFSSHFRHVAFAAAAPPPPLPSWEWGEKGSLLFWGAAFVWVPLSHSKALGAIVGRRHYGA